jgi:hypothetical protein
MSEQQTKPSLRHLILPAFEMVMEVSMRTGLMAAAIIIVAAGAQAKTGPAPELRLTMPPSDYATTMIATGAMLESDYFRAPSQRVTSGSTCRMYFDPFEKERLARRCR